jgi:predicted transcriptional regulator
MKKHSGMRPHDVVVLLKIIAKGKQAWLNKDLANELHISQSEISESLNRSKLAGLISADKKNVASMALLDFLSYGLRYVYPEQPSSLVRGIPTSHSAPPLNSTIQSEQNYVWPYAKGEERGFSVRPLHPNVPKACLEDTKLYELLALTDALRLGRVRERNLAIEELEKRIM